MTAILVEVSDCNGLAVKKVFHGRWLTDEPLCGEDNDGDADDRAEWSVAETRQGALAVYVTHPDAAKLTLYDSLADMEGVVPPNVIAAVAAALGQDYVIKLDK